MELQRLLAPKSSPTPKAHIASDPESAHEINLVNEMMVLVQSAATKPLNKKEMQVVLDVFSGEQSESLKLLALVAIRLQTAHGLTSLPDSNLKELLSCLDGTAAIAAIAQDVLRQFGPATTAIPLIDAAAPVVSSGTGNDRLRSSIYTLYTNQGRQLAFDLIREFDPGEIQAILNKGLLDPSSDIIHYAKNLIGAYERMSRFFDEIRT